MPNDSKGQGQAIFQVNREGTEIRFKLIASNIENVTQAHIHCCANSEGTAGVVVWLYPAAPPQRLIPGRSDGVLAEGVIRQSSLVGGLAGQPLSTLLDRIASGLAYVNVHTTQFPPGKSAARSDNRPHDPTVMRRPAYGGPPPPAPSPLPHLRSLPTIWHDATSNLYMSETDIMRPC